MHWPFSRRQQQEDESNVAKARRKRDRAFTELDDAVDMVDRVHDRIVKQYQAAEDHRLKKKP